MYKSEIISVVADLAASTKKDTENIINVFLDVITDKLAAGEKVIFTGFGSFEVSERSAREGVNPKTGEKIQIEATRTPKFKAGSALKSAVKGK